MSKPRHGIYTGPDTRLFNKGTLLMVDPANECNWLCQFDALHLTESHGWWPVPKESIVNVEYEEGET